MATINISYSISPVEYLRYLRKLPTFILKITVTFLFDANVLVDIFPMPLLKWLY